MSNGMNGMNGMNGGNGAVGGFMDAAFQGLTNLATSNVGSIGAGILPSIDPGGCGDTCSVPEFTGDLGTDFRSNQSTVLCKDNVCGLQMDESTLYLPFYNQNTMVPSPSGLPRPNRANGNRANGNRANGNRRNVEPFRVSSRRG